MRWLVDVGRCFCCCCCFACMMHRTFNNCSNMLSRSLAGLPAVFLSHCTPRRNHYLSCLLCILHFVVACVYCVLLCVCMLSQRLHELHWVCICTLVLRWKGSEAILTTTTTTTTSKQRKLCDASEQARARLRVSPSDVGRALNSRICNTINSQVKWPRVQCECCVECCV